MIVDGIHLLGASRASNFKLEAALTLPAVDNFKGKLFFQDGVGLVLFDGTTWMTFGGGGVSSVNTHMGPNVVLKTVDVAEDTNLYFTTQRARAAFSAESGLEYDPITGLFSLTPVQATPEGVTAFVGVPVTTSIVTLPPYADAAVYTLSVATDTTITLPSTSALAPNKFVSISVKIKQTEVSTITWAAQDGHTIVFDDPTTLPAGKDKTTIYCFTQFYGDPTWLASIVWSQL